jgi:hypothetical protein
MAAAKTFWTSFLDGFTGEGIFGDLRLSGAPTRIFKPEPQADPIVVPHTDPGIEVRAEEFIKRI